jgi:MFS family permease
MNLFRGARDLLAGCDWRIHPTGETTMSRKLAIALTATAALAAAALAPTSASAWTHHYGHGHGWGWGAAAFGAAAATAVIASNSYYYGPNCYVVRRWVDTPAGPQPRRFTVCN